MGTVCGQMLKDAPAQYRALPGIILAGRTGELLVQFAQDTSGQGKDEETGNAGGKCPFSGEPLAHARMLHHNDFCGQGISQGFA